MVGVNSDVRMNHAMIIGVTVVLTTPFTPRVLATGTNNTLNY
jgi:hypothetical protein